MRSAWRIADPFRGQRLAILILGALIILRLADPWILEAVRLKSFDAFMTFAADDTESPEVVIVDIDETSLAALGQWPWPRNRLARIVDRVAAQGPAAVGIDILFAEPDQHSSESFLRSQPSLPPRLRDAISALPSNDMVFAESLAQMPAVLGVVTGFAPAQTAEGPHPPSRSAEIMEFGGNPRPYLQTSQDLLRPITALEAASSGQAVINLGFERDGILRRVPAVVSAGNRLLPAMSLELVRLANRNPAFGVMVARSGIEGIVHGNLQHPTDRFGRLWVNFSRAGAYTTVPAKNLLDGTKVPDVFGGKIVLIGTSAAGTATYVPTSLGAVMPSLRIHAELVSTLLLEHPVTRSPNSLLIELVAALAAGLCLIAAQTRCIPRRMILICTALIAAIVLLTWIGLSVGHRLLDPTFPALAAILVLPAAISARLVQEDRARREAQRLSQEREREREARIRSLQAELLRASRESAMGHLSSALSHELNQPLAAIHNFVQAARILFNRDKEMSDSKLDALLEKALDQARRGSSILRGMRDVVERGEITARPSDINAIVHEAVDLCGETYQIRVNEVELILAPDLPDVLANPVQIHQVLINLVENAFDALEEETAGVTKGAPITIETRAVGESSVEVIVSDRGPGLSDEVLANPFKPFLTTKADGMGLGLSICQAIVEAHGGRLVAEANEGGGTRFRFTLPTNAFET